MSADWTPAFAEELAAAEGIELGEKHWCVIATAREFVALHDLMPSLAELCAICGLTVRQLNALFPGAAEEVLARLAGAPELERKER